MLANGMVCSRITHPPPGAASDRGACTATTIVEPANLMNGTRNVQR